MPDGVGFFAVDVISSAFATVGDWIEIAALASYALFAAAYLAGSIRSVSFEGRWLRPIWAIDWIAFTIILAASGGFQSSYFSMFGLLVLAGIRALGTRRVLWIGAGILVPFALSGVLAHVLGRADTGEQEFATGRIVAVLAYGYIVFALAFRRPPMAVPVPRNATIEGGGSLPDRVLGEALRMLNADRGLIRWSDAHSAGYRAQRNGICGDTAILDQAEPWFEGIFLYDRKAGMAIRYEPDGAVFAVPPNRGAQAVAALFDTDRLIFVRLECAGFDSALAIAVDAPLDEEYALRALSIQKRLQDGILATLARDAQRADAKAAERAALARNLHDSAIQSLASIRLQLASLKQGARGASGGEANAGRIAAIDATADAEMRNLRQLVGDLDASPVSGDEFRASLERLAKLLSKQWQIACTLDPRSSIEPVGVSGHRATDAFLAIREAVSNAVRHGAADRVSIRVEAAAGQLAIDIVNNGRALAAGEAGRPRSLHGRVADSGGEVELRNTPDGVRLSIIMPAS